MSTHRLKRVNELVKQEVSAGIRRCLPVESYGVVSVTDVEVSRDLKVANVYISTVAVGPPADEKSILQALERVRGQLQGELARKVIIKYTPQLVFKWDRGLERGQHILEILDELGRKAPAAAAAPRGQADEGGRQK